MEFRDDPLTSVIEEIAALLATGYLRLRTERTLSESAPPLGLRETGEPRDSAPGAGPRGAINLMRERKEPDFEPHTQQDGN